MRQSTVVIMMVTLAVFLMGAARAPAPFDSEVSRVSSKHPRVIMAPRAGSYATLTILFHAGSADEGASKGLTRLAQHALLEANTAEDCTAFHRDVYAAAASLTLTTGVREAGFSLTARKDHFESLASRLLRLVLFPKVAERGLPRARRLALNAQPRVEGTEPFLGVLAAAVSGKEANKGVQAVDDRNANAAEMAWLKKSKLADVDKFVGTRLVPANATVIITGAFNGAALQKILEKAKYGKSMRTPGPARTDLDLALRTSTDGGGGAYLRAVGTPLKTPRDVAAVRLLASVLQDLTLWQLRHHGVANRSVVEPVIQDWMDGMLVVVPLVDGNDAQVGPLVEGVLQQLRGGELPDAVFQSNHAAVLKELHAADRDSAALAAQLAQGAGRISWYEPAVVREFTNMQKDRFLATVKPWMPEGGVTNVPPSPAPPSSSSPPSSSPPSRLPPPPPPPEGAR